MVQPTFHAAPRGGARRRTTADQPELDNNNTSSSAAAESSDTPRALPATNTESHPVSATQGIFVLTTVRRGLVTEFLFY